MKRLLLLFGVISCWITAQGQGYTFSPAGASGQYGPTQTDVNTAYIGTPLGGNVTVNNGIQYWVVPSSGNYIINAVGASGGGVNGGYGADMEGVFALTAGDTLLIAVGQQGAEANDVTTSGGGGTYVVLRDPTSSTTMNISGTPVTPLIIAGGGGGNPGATHVNSNATITTAGNAGAGGTDFGAGGTNGNGGDIAVSNGNNRGGGGGGFLTDGERTGTCTNNGEESGLSFLNGSDGGQSTSCGSTQVPGGFGGGGGGITTGWRSSGGGGGYSGGGGGQTNSNPATDHRGGGGGSYNAGLGQQNLVASTTGDGMVIITPISSAPNDAGVVSVDSPMVYCAGTHDVVATVQNFGTSQITSLTVNWSVDGVAQTPYSITGTLDTLGGNNPSFAQLTLGSYAFTTAPHQVKIWTSSPNGNPDTVNSNDTVNTVLQSNLPAPTALAVSNITSSSADFSWTPGSNSNTWLYANVGTGASPSGPGTSVSSPNVSLSGLNPTTSYDFYVREVCPGGDTSAWAGPLTYVTPIAGPRGVNCPSNNPVTIFTEEFDSQGGWTGDISTSNGDWQLNSGTTGSSNTGPSGAHSGNNYIFFEASGSGPAAMVSPAIDLTLATDSAELSFWMHAYGSDVGYLMIRVSTSSATGPFNDTLFYYDQGELQTSSSDPWQNVGVRLDNYVGQQIWLEFTADRASSFNGDISIDLIEVNTCGNICISPSSLSAVNITDNSADLDWTENSNATSWDIEFGPAGFTPTGIPTNATVANRPFAVTGLQPTTGYDFYVRSDCGGTTGLSGWAGPFSFVTAIAGPRGVNCTSGNSTVIFADEFDQNVPWTGDIGTSTGLWQYNSGGTGTGSTGPSGAHSGNNYIYFEASGTGPAAMQSPAIDLSQATDSAELAFWLHAYGDGIDYLVLRVSTASATGPFTDTIFNLQGEVQTSSGDPWQHVGVRLDQYVGQTIWLEFEAGRNNLRGDVAIDLLTVETCGNFCLPEPYSVDSIVAGLTSAMVHVDNSGDSFDFEWGPCGFMQGTGTVVTSGSPVQITGLAPSTCYDVYIRRNCVATGAGVSSWQKHSFETGCLFFAPFIEDFESGYNIGDAGNQIQGCITAHATSNPRWFIGTGSTGSSGTGPDGDATLYPATNGTYIFLETSGGSQNDSDYFETGLIDISALTAPYINFAYHMHGATTGMLKVEYHDGAQWQFADTIVGEQQTSQSDPWVSRGIAIDTNVLQTDTIMLRFTGYRGSSFTGDISIDDIEVKEAPACQPLTLADIVVDTLSSDSLHIFWIPTGEGVSWEVEYGFSGFTPGSGALGTFSVADTFWGIGGLMADTMYDVYLRDSCLNGSYSRYVGPLFIQTPLQGPQGVNCTSGGSTFLMMEEFDSQGGWTGDIGTSNGQWQYNTGGTGSGSTGPSGAHSGSNYIYFEASGSGPAELISPAIDLTTAVDGAELAFWIHAYGDGIDYFNVGISNSASGPFTTLWSLTSELQSSNNDPWQHVGIDISAYLGQVIYLEFEAERTNFRADVAIDLLTVEACGNFCLPPDNLTATGIVDTAATLSWDTTSAGSYEVWFGPQGFFQGTQTAGGARSVATTNSFLVDTLTGQSCYEYFVRGICGNDTSLWAGPFDFCTPCSPVVAPYFEDFDALPSNSATGDLGNCWVTTPDATGPFSWRTNSGTTGSGSTGPSGDATTGSGVYLYTEASGNSQGDSTFAYSPLIDISGLSPVEMRYAYHMYGSNTGSLIVEVNSGSGWVQESIFQGPQHTSSNDPWKIDTVDLSAYSGLIQVRFKAIRGSGFTGDMAIDDFIVEQPVPTDLGIVSAEFDKNSLCLSSNDTVVYQVQNVKGATYDLSTDPLVLHYDITGPVNSTGSATFNTGTIPAGDTATFMVTGIDLSLAGSYSLDAWIGANNFNLSALNDTLSAPSTVNVREVWNVEPDSVVVITNTTDTVELKAESAFFSGSDFMITEVCHYAGFGTGGPTGTWNIDDYIEITGVPGADLAGYTLEQWENGSLDGTHTFTAGTVLGPNGTAVIAVGSGNNNADPTNFIYDGRGGSGTWGSGSDAGRILKDPSGNIIDAVGYPGSSSYSFPAASGVTAADWSGNTAAANGTAGIRLEGPDLNNASNWVVVTGTNPQDPNVLNTNVPLPAPTSMAGFSWSLNGVVVDTMPETVVGPYTQSGVHNYIATYNSPCGVFTDTVVVIVNLPGSCPTPTNLGANVIACDSVDVSWNNAADSALVWHVPTGTTPTGAGTLVIGDSTLNITGTMVNTTYDFYVANICGSDTTALAGPFSFDTDSAGAPVASFTYSPVGFGLTVNFDASGSTGTGNTYAWDFGDGNLGTGMTPPHTYASGGSYSVTLTVTNACGVDDTTIIIADVSIRENALGRSLNMFPNPASGEVNLSFTADGAATAEVRVTDMTGKTVMLVRQEQQGGGEHQLRLDVSHLADGIYMVEITSGDMKAVRRLIKD